MLDHLLLGAALGFAIAATTTPVGVSGAVFLIPVQISILGTPSPAITPTNFLFNLLAVPGALLRFRSDGRLGGPLARLMLAGTLPGVVAGAVVRVTLLGGGQAFLLVVAAVLVPLGAWLAFGRPPRLRSPGSERLGRAGVRLLALAVGVVGGIYGIGGGAILGPILVGSGFSIFEVAPAAFSTGFFTSLAGVATYALLSIGGQGDIAPDWALGIAIGLGGLCGSYLGAAVQPRLPERLLRRGLGVLALLVGARYALQGLT